MGVRIDTSQVDALAVDLSRAPERMKRAAAKTMKRSALEIKKQMRRDFAGHDYAPRVPYSLEFQNLGGLRYEIGELDSAGPQWGIAAILAFGTSNNTPVLDFTAGLRREAPSMVQHLLDGGVDSVFGGPE